LYRRRRGATGKIQLHPPFFYGMIFKTGVFMATKQHKRIDSKGHEEIWEWEETPELIAALKKLEESKVEE